MEQCSVLQFQPKALSRDSHGGFKTDQKTAWRPVHPWDTIPRKEVPHGRGL